MLLHRKSNLSLECIQHTIPGLSSLKIFYHQVSTHPNRINALKIEDNRKSGPERTKPRQRGGAGMVGLTRLELVTSRMSSERSNQLSYRPILPSSVCRNMVTCRNAPALFPAAQRYLAQGLQRCNPPFGFLQKNLHDKRMPRPICTMLVPLTACATKAT